MSRKSVNWLLRWFALGLALTVSGNVHAEEPHIEYIESFLKTNVLIHFDTDANRTYVLQFTEQFPSAGLTNTFWTNLYVAPNIPFPNHYVILDTGTRRQRFYRLMVTP